MSMAKSIIQMNSLNISSRLISALIHNGYIPAEKHEDILKDEKLKPFFENEIIGALDTNNSIDEGKKSGYVELFNDGTNNREASLIGNYHTKIHSQKIKSGNQLEQYMMDDFKENRLDTNFSFKKFNKTEDEGLEKLIEQAPCVINSYQFNKSYYEKYGEICKNKKAIEVDFISIDKGLNINLFEVKSGCSFDTKKSKGEVQSLTSTMNILNKSGLFGEVKSYFVCYDATCIQDISLKTDTGIINKMTFEEMSENFNIKEGGRNRIDDKKKRCVHSNINSFKNLINDIIVSDGN